jgi:tetratricopeptide (TPR) repeat protein
MISSTRLIKYTFILFTCCATVATAQNTIGGVKKEVPEAEVERQTQFLEAESFRMLSKNDKAIDTYKKFLYNNESYDAAWYGLARCYSETKQYGNALDAIDKAIKINPENKWYLLHKADIYEKNGQIINAADVYDQLVKKNPKTPEFLERLAYLSILSENPKRGIKALDQLEAMTGISEITASKKHLIYVAMGDKTKAANELRRLCEAYPRDLDFKRILAKYYNEIGDKNAEKAVWNDILRLNPTDAEAKLGALDQGKNSPANAKLEAMLPLFKDPAVSIDAKIKEISPSLATLNKNSDQGTINGLLALGNALITLHKDEPKAWSIAGDLFYLLDRNDEALVHYKKCIDLRPKVFSVWDNALTILTDQKKYSEALPLADKAIDAFPNQPKAYLWYGLTANALQKPDLAQPALEQAIVMCGNNVELLLEVTDQLGVSLTAQNKPDDAIARFDKIMAKGGDKNANILEHYGDALAAKGDRSKALEWWKKAKAIRTSPALEQKISGQ